jgi:hypothetical protein
MSSLSDEDRDAGEASQSPEPASVRLGETDNPAARSIDALHGSASSILLQIAELADETEISFGAIVDALEERAFGMLIFLFAIPALIPFLVGVQSFVALPICLLAGQMIVGQKRPWLPRRVRTQTMTMATFRKMTNAVVPWLKRIERLTKPRLKVLAGRGAEPILGIFMIIFAIIVAIPGPGTNGVPGVAIALIALAMIERDGVLAIIGSVLGVLYAALLFTLGYAAIEFAVHQAVQFFN